VTELSPDWTPRLGRGARLHRDAVRGVDLLLVPERAVTLNPTASAVLGMCDGTRTVADISEALSVRYEGPELRADLDAFLAAARRERWLR